MRNLLGLAFVFSLTGCYLLADRWDFWHRRDLKFHFDPVPAYQGITINRIGLYWQNDAEPLDTLKPSKVIWEAVAAKPVAIGGFSFELFQVPSGFKLTSDNRGSMEKGGKYFVKGMGFSSGSKLSVLYTPISYKEIVKQRGR